MRPSTYVATAAVALLGQALPAHAASPATDAVRAGVVTLERPTLISLGFDWAIEGDANRNAVAAVEYRKAGETAWRKGLPLFRLQNEVIGTKPDPDSVKPVQSAMYFVAPNGFSGSLFNLEPGTAYELRFTLADPDGARGKTVQTLTARTRAEPTPAPGGRVFHVYPHGYTGPKQEPAFEGLLQAYYLGAAQADYFDTYPPRVRPGDTILVHAGVYKDVRSHYGGFDRREAAYGTVFDGTYYLTAKGTPEKPIVIKGAGDGEVVFDGDGNGVLFDLTAADYTYVEGITVRNTEVGFLTGRKHIAGSSGFTLKHSRIENVGRGVHGDWAGSHDIYIADNVFVGRHDPTRLLGWTAYPWAKFPGYPSAISGPGGSEYAVKVYGQGHVVAYNRVSGFHDAIDHATYGSPEPDPTLWPSSIDFYGNDISNTDDNCFEGDGVARNIRIFRNRCFNSGQPGLSLQPAFGGPAYVFENLLYNQITGSLKFTAQGSGVFFAHNTVIGEARNWGAFGNQHYVDNLFLAQGALGQNAQAPTPPLLDVATSTAYSTSDYNGFAPWPGAAISFQWAAPAPGKAVDFTGPLTVRSFKTLADYAAATGQDRHSVQIAYDTFVKASPPDSGDPQRLYDPKDYDFRLRPGSPAIGSGVPLPNLDDDRGGAASDLGAYQSGRALPDYGPRSGAR